MDVFDVIGGINGRLSVSFVIVIWTLFSCFVVHNASILKCITGCGNCLTKAAWVLIEWQNVS